PHRGRHRRGEARVRQRVPDPGDPDHSRARPAGSRRRADHRSARRGVDPLHARTGSARGERVNTHELIGSGALWLAIPVAMLAGLVSFLSPCVLPLVPGYLGFLGGAVAPRSATPSTAEPVEASGTPGRGRLVLGVLLF